MFNFISFISRGVSKVFFRLRYYNFFRALGSRVYFVSPFRIDGQEYIEIGSNTFAQRGLWLYCANLAGIKPRLRIGDGCILGYNNHITCVGDVTIGKSVLTANNVYISDNLHNYEDISKPIMQQSVLFKRAVTIGDGSWIGENVSIIGASIGKNCVIGANAVVTHDIPDYSVAVGVPAVVIRQYDQQKKNWVVVSAKESGVVN